MQLDPLIRSQMPYPLGHRALHVYQHHPLLPSSLQPPPLPPTLSSDPASLPAKGQVVDHLLQFIDEGLVRWCREADLSQLCVTNHKQLLEMKVGTAQLPSTRNLAF